MDLDELIDICVKQAEEYRKSIDPAEEKAEEERFRKLSPEEKVQETLAKADTFIKLDQAWRKGSSCKFAYAMSSLLLELGIGLSGNSAFPAFFDARYKFVQTLKGLKDPVTIDDVIWGTHDDSNYTSSSIYMYLNDAMIDIQRFGGYEPPHYFHEPFASYLRDGMVSKLSYDEALQIYEESDYFSSYHQAIPESLAAVRNFRKYFLESFSYLTFLHEGMAYYDEIMDAKKKFLQVYAYECLFSSCIVV